MPASMCLSFGGTKNGMMYGEAVVFFDPKLAPTSNTFASRACTCRRRCASSRRNLRRDAVGRLVAAWPTHANRMAQLLAE
jgi:threonine aldolase